MNQWEISADTRPKNYDPRVLDQYNDLLIAVKELSNSNIDYDANPLAGFLKISPSLLGWMRNDVAVNSDILARYALTASVASDDTASLLMPTALLPDEATAFEHEIMHLVDSFSNSLFIEKHQSTVELAKRVAELQEDNESIDEWADRLAKDISLAND